jgi:hypothetical protein
MSNQVTKKTLRRELDSILTNKMKRKVTLKNTLKTMKRAKIILIAVRTILKTIIKQFRIQKQ